jgi:uncharacterized protein (DUF2336 family)
MSRQRTRLKTVISENLLSVRKSMPQGGIERRRADAALFRAIVDQFVTRPLHTEGERDRFETLVRGLVPTLDPGAVADCAADLCRHPETPPGVIAELLDVGGRAARVAFELAPSIHPELARVTAEHGPAEVAAAIARRASLDRKIVAILASRGESEVLCALAGNRRAHLDQTARRALAQVARDDLRLARVLLDRADLSLDPEPLFLAAGAQERQAIVLAATARALASPAPEMSARAQPQIVAAIEACALARDLAGLADALAEGLDCRKSRARAILGDAGGEGLALALLVIGVGEDAAIRIFLGAEPETANVERVRGLVALMRSTPPRVAQRIVAAMTGAARPEKERTPLPHRAQAAEIGRAGRRNGKRRLSAKLHN